MKLFHLLITLLVSFVFVSCSKVQPLPQKSSDSKSSATILVSMYDESKDKNSYRVYINHKDINTTLSPNTQNVFNVKVGRVNVQIVKKRETASIDLVVLKNKTYRLRIFKNERSHIELLQVPNTSN